MYSFQHKDLPQVAKPKAAQFDSFAQATSRQEQKDFCDPHKVVHQLGIKEGMKVADLGTGTGAYAKLFAHAVGAGGTVYALDVQKDVLQRLKRDLDQKGFTNITYIWANIEKIGGTHLADASVDLVLLSNVLFQVEDLQMVLAETSRICKPKARVAIIDWEDSFNGMGPSAKQVIPKGEMLRATHEAGFSHLTDFAAGSHHYGIMIEKPAV